jgi:hypothetical protein
MSSPNIRFINVKTISTVNYEASNKIWLVSLDPKFGCPFVTGKVFDDSNANLHHYKVECDMTEGLSMKIPSTSTFLSEILILDGLTKEDERIVTTTVHEARMFRMSLETINAAGIGHTAFTHYPTTDGEENALRPTVPMDQYVNDAKYKVTDLIIQCNERRNRQPSLEIRRLRSKCLSSCESKRKSKRTSMKFKVN